MALRRPVPVAALLRAFCAQYPLAAHFTAPGREPLACMVWWQGDGTRPATLWAPVPWHTDPPVPA